MIEWPEFEMWLRRAESNLILAQHGPEEGVFLEDLCFEAQQAAEKALIEALGAYLKDAPSVTISPLQLLGNKIYVLGKVNRPGEYPINRPTDVMQALALAGGLNTFASEGRINVLRRNKAGVQTAMPFDYGDVKDGDELETNIVLKAGDVVVVP